MTSSNGNTVLLGLCEGNPAAINAWIPLTKASDAERLCFVWCAPEQTVEQTLDLPVICDAVMVMWRHCNAFKLEFHGRT